jgi:hypothetical protein
MVGMLSAAEELPKAMNLKTRTKSMISKEYLEY